MSFIKLPVLSNGLTMRHEDILPDAALEKRMESVRELMQRKNVKALVIYGNGAVCGPVCYLTNYPAYRIGRRTVAVLGLTAGPFLYTADPSRNVPAVRRFTSCDLEGSKKFFSKACQRARELAGNGTIGLVDGKLLTMELAESLEKELAGLKITGISKSFKALIAVKDESSIRATMKALNLAEEGAEILRRQVSSGKDLWQLAAYLDYRLRLLGCENTNILLGYSTGGHIRPGYPDRTLPQPGNIIVAYVAVQYARHWGVLGLTLPIGPADNNFQDNYRRLDTVRKLIGSAIQPGLSLGETEKAILTIGHQNGLVLAPDMPLVNGVGFDLAEYPVSTADWLEPGMVLQVVLCADFTDGATGLSVDMLKINDSGSVVLSKNENLW